MDSDAETVMQLRSELRDKEMKLTDIRLEALSSAHQLDQLRESMNRMQVTILPQKTCLGLLRMIVVYLMSFFTNRLRSKG